jgi:menaquinone-specific isochorismate synthase
VVLAREVLARAENDLDLRWLAGRLAAGYPQCWTYLVDGLVGASPEMLVKREARLAVSRVLAGTIQRTGDDDHDLNLAAALAKSSKDLQEHEYAVASVARTLSPSCSGMNVPEAPYVLELPNVLHLATDVTGVVEGGVSSLALAAALHPTAAVCGTPTEQARALIGELEHLDRERYAGPVGWIDASGDGEWAIALRCGLISETDPQQIRLFAGCGIVAGSDPAAELAESRAKLVPVRDALSG